MSMKLKAPMAAAFLNAMHTNMGKREYYCSVLSEDGWRVTRAVIPVEPHPIFGRQSNEIFTDDELIKFARTLGWKEEENMAIDPRAEAAAEFVNNHEAFECKWSDFVHSWLVCFAFVPCDFWAVFLDAEIIKFAKTLGWVEIND